MATPTPSNVMVGAAYMYLAPANTAMPAQSVAFGGTWPSGWVYVGATEAGVKFSVDRKTQDIMIEEQSTPVLVTTDTMTASVEASLAEDTVANMQWAYGGGTLTTVAATTTNPGYTTLALSDTLEQVAVGFEGLNTFGLARRLYIPVAISAAKVDTEYRRAKAARLYPITITAICPPADIVVTEVTAPAV